MSHNTKTLILLLVTFYEVIGAAIKKQRQMWKVGRSGVHQEKMDNNPKPIILIICTCIMKWKVNDAAQWINAQIACEMMNPFLIISTLSLSLSKSCMCSWFPFSLFAGCAILFYFGLRIYATTLPTCHIIKLFSWFYIIFYSSTNKFIQKSLLKFL